MPLIMNSLDEEKSIRCGGNIFTFKANQVKHFHQPEIASFIAEKGSEEGFIPIDDKYEDLEARHGQEYSDHVSAQKKLGIERYCAKLRRTVHNLQVSIRTDLEKMNIKSDARAYASDGELEALEKLVKYQANKGDAEQEKINKFKSLEKQLKE